MRGKPYLNIEVDEHFSSVGVLTRVEAFINSLKSERVQTSEALTLKQYSEMVMHKTTKVQSRLDELDETTELYLPYLYPYAQLTARYLQSRGYKAQVLPKTSKRSLDLGRKYTLSKEYLTLTGLVGDVLAKASQLEKSSQNYGFLIPTSEGSEVEGQYYRLLKEKLDGANLSNAKIIAPFIEDWIKDSTFSQDLFQIFLAGDLINLVPKNKRPAYFEKIIQLIENKALSIDRLIVLAKEIQKIRELNKANTIFVLGEVNVLFNDLLNNNTLKSLENQGIEIIRAPLSEYMWFIWRDFLAQKNNKKETLAFHNLMKFFEDMKEVAKVLRWANPFENEPEDLIYRADEYLGLYAGGNGRYRYAKVLGDLSFASGIITVASMCENTNTILNILSAGTNTSTIPVLNLTFDGSENEIDKSKIDSFTYYALKEAKRGA